MAELWDSRGSVRAVRVRDLGRDDIADKLRSGKIRFVVADVGHPLL
jgi:hypothetical protein